MSEVREVIVSLVGTDGACIRSVGIPAEVFTAVRLALQHVLVSGYGSLYVGNDHRYVASAESRKGAR